MNNESSGGITIASLLGVLFIGLKLGGVITWSWVWVLAPFWIPAAVSITIFAVILIIVFSNERY